MKTGTVRAKFQCDKIEETTNTKEVFMSAVHSEKGENKDFFDASPWGDFKIGIDKGRPAADYFEPGKEYYFDISEAPEQE